MNISQSDKVWLEGIVKSVKVAEGYAFLSHTQTGIDHFFHRSALVGQVDWEDLEVMQHVEFVAEEGPKGHRAVEVRLV